MFRLFYLIKSDHVTQYFYWIAAASLNFFIAFIHESEKWSRNHKTNSDESEEGWQRGRLVWGRAARLMSPGCSDALGSSDDDCQQSRPNYFWTRRCYNLPRCRPLWLTPWPSVLSAARRERRSLVCSDFYNRTMSRTHTFTFSDCVEFQCSHITDDKALKCESHR